MIEQCRRCASMVAALSTVVVPLPGRLAGASDAARRRPAIVTHLFTRPARPAAGAPRVRRVAGDRPSSLPVVAVTPARPVIGRPVHFTVRGSVATAGYAWDLGATGRYTTATGSSPSVTHIYRVSGLHRVSVRVTDGTRIRSVTVVLMVGAGADPRARRTRAGRSTPPRPVGGGPAARVATDGSVRIADFAFTPGTATVHVGDTVTWVNSGPSAHSATATDGSFDTGVLAKGATGSHTFTSAGTFAYVCKIHPFMHGTVVVLAAAAQTTRPSPGTTTSGAPPARTSGSTVAPAATSGAASLPLTGVDVAAVALTGAAALAAGLALRRAARSPGKDSGRSVS